LRQRPGPNSIKISFDTGNKGLHRDDR
jgi:hypothetical protein